MVWDALSMASLVLALTSCVASVAKFCNFDSAASAAAVGEEEEDSDDDLLVVAATCSIDDVCDDEGVALLEKCRRGIIDN